MALSKIERELLVAARERIKRRQDWFICHALENLARNDRHSREALFRLRTYIQKALYPHTVLEDWQRANGLYGRKLFDDRVAWIDWMLDQPEIEE